MPESTVYCPKTSLNVVCSVSNSLLYDAQFSVKDCYWQCKFRDDCAGWTMHWTTGQCELGSGFSCELDMTIDEPSYDYYAIDDCGKSL